MAQFHNEGSEGSMNGRVNLTSASSELSPSQRPSLPSTTEASKKRQATADAAACAGSNAPPPSLRASARADAEALAQQLSDATVRKSEARAKIEAALNVVGLLGEEVLRKYPHQLSGGQRQRVGIESPIPSAL